MYLIGIDLGTTNSTVSYVNLKEENAPIERLQITQTVDSGIKEGRDMLPSFLYLPLDQEIEAKLVESECIGLYARERGKELPDRVVSSVKSWLCHKAVDCHSPIHLGKFSPVEVTALFLKKIKESWDQKFSDAPLSEQKVIITVPASFDPKARDLVEEAAALAGYRSPVLFEEPQAAFYAYLKQHQEHFRDILKVGDTILVVDVGGGTTDFSLIKASDKGGEMELERVKVGSHLLLGGDNLDLTIAHFVKAKMEEKGQELDEWQFKSLLFQARQAKEKLLGDNPPSSLALSISGKSSRLIGSSLKAEITLQEVQELLVEGFFPLVSLEEKPYESSAALHTTSLPYASDPRVTAHLAHFLKNESSLPTHVLFNGGTMKSVSLRKRVEEQLNQWSLEERHKKVVELERPDYDFAVSQGAVCYGLAKEGRGIRVKAGLSASYFIGIEETGLAVPGMKPNIQALCLAPIGMEEGTSVEIKDLRLNLLIGRPALFRFFTTQSPLLEGQKPYPGLMIKKWRGILEELPAVESAMESKEPGVVMVEVYLEAKLTELGTLELYCVTADNERWKLEYNVRK